MGKEKKKAQKRAKGCRHHNTTSEFVPDMTDYKWTFCDDCRTLVSLGAANDDSEAVRVEIRAARHLGDAEGQLPDVWDMGGGTLAFGSSEHLPETWPWDPKRPVAGQYEERLAAQSQVETCSAGRSLATLANAMIDIPTNPVDYEAQRAAEPDCRDEDGPEVERLMVEAKGGGDLTCPECDGPADHCADCGAPNGQAHMPGCARIGSTTTLTASEAAECAALSDSDVCQACGDRWTEHGQTCSGSATQEPARG